MKTSELIQRLAAVIMNEGDIPVCVYAPCGKVVEVQSAEVKVDKMVNEDGETKTELFVVVDCSQ